MDVQKEQKATFLLHLNIRKKKLAVCLLHNIDIAVVSVMSLSSDSAVSTTAMSNLNSLLSQKVCHCLDQGCTLHDILLWATH